MNILVNTEDLENFDSVKRWTVSILKSPRGEGTVRGYLKRLRIFCEWAGKTPDQLIEERVQDLKSDDVKTRARAEETLDQFYADYKARSQTNAVYIHKVVKSFYNANHLPLTTKSPRPRIVREEEIVPTTEQTRRMADISDLRNKALIVWLAEGGFRIGSLTQLRLKHVEKDFNAGRAPCMVEIPSSISKGGRGYHGFVCQDAVDLMKQQLDERRNLGEQITRESYLFTSAEGKHLSMHRAITVVRNAAIGAALIPREAGLRALHTHCFRKRVQTILEGSGTPLNWVDYMLGHVPRGADAGAYSRPTPEQLREEYAKVMPKLQIYGVQGQIDMQTVEDLAVKRAQEIIQAAIMNLSKMTTEGSSPQYLKMVDANLRMTFAEYDAQRKQKSKGAQPKALPA